MLTIIVIILIVLIIIILSSSYIDNFEEDISKNNFVTVIYENTEGTTTTNLIKLLKKFGYNYRIVGFGNEWNGWYGRLQNYQKFVNMIDDDVYVLFCDGRDVLVNTNYSDFIEKAKNMYKNKIIFGSETHCCNGIENLREESMDQNIPIKDIYVKYMEDLAHKTINNYKYKYFYLNFGLIFGKAKDFKHFFKALNIQPGDDDQGLATRELYRNPDLYQLDYNQELFSNMIHTCDYVWDESKKMFKHTITGTYPSILHFPGKNFECYNKILDKLQQI